MSKQITTQTALVEALKEIATSGQLVRAGKGQSTFLEKDETRDAEANGFIISNFTISNFWMGGIKFINCTFESCRFGDFQFNGVEFTECHFSNCSFESVVFMDCSLRDIKFDHTFSNTIYFGMTTLENVEFIENELQFATFSDCGLHKLSFIGGWIVVAKFEPFEHAYFQKSRLVFRDISLQSVVFIDLDLTVSDFKDCEMGVSFVNSILSSKTIGVNKTGTPCNIDLATILASEKLPLSVLKDNFGIQNLNVQEIIRDITKAEEYQSVFISYSFKDREFGKELNKVLKGLGIKTFFWEVDAPGAKKLKKIMRDSIREYNKFLFLASQYSLKSEACHYEISEARAKYHETWKEIFVPIHIDDYLFQVGREDIPNKLADHYWENIEQLKEFHSLDFSNTDVENICSCVNLKKLVQCLKK